MATFPSKRPTTRRLNFRPTTSDANIDQRGTKPTSEPTSIKEIFTLMVLYCCKKSLFFNTNLKVAIYLGALFIISLLADVFTVPKIYLSRSDNIFNRLFVKFAWGWNLMLLVPFVLCTTYIYCCGKKSKIIRYHLLRIGVATFFWWFWTTFFNFIEASFGKCNNVKFNAKGHCLQAGHIWNGFDLSGHSFILIYGSLVLIEETKCMLNWDSIKDHIRLEEHARATKDTAQSTNPLRYLTDVEFKQLQFNYEKYTPYIRILFIVITMFQVMWDVMLVCTMLYYHIMIEKFLGGAFAILTWFFTYRVWFAHPKLLPKMPGEGEFKYIKKATKETLPPSRRRTGSLVNGNQVPMFMGRQLYTANAEGDGSGR
ncbi:acyl-coenzyme A diphosphatase FITM2 [Aethina tumida]|uniref:acyl-coenzyme A diphosphatase FITM2 n=1 Tax=Aethina tumida TaxID=116153 RepID=UPI0021494E4B|nr:acyl-coenzyme A diphosphatase FITM2 [Aethina tumida]